MNGKDILIFTGGVLVGWLVLPMLLGMMSKRSG